MYYVYILQSEHNPKRYYTGFTRNVKKRVAEHSSGKNISTHLLRPWRLKSFVAFMDKDRAHAFERYLKTGSGRAFGLRQS